jgi:hypothetical protein
VGDWTGTGHAGVGVFDPTTGTWYLRNSATPGAPDVGPFSFGAPGWKPVVGDWDGNGTATVGAFDPVTATWYLRNSNSGGSPDVLPFSYGVPGWSPVAGVWSAGPSPSRPADQTAPPSPGVPAEGARPAQGPAGAGPASAGTAERSHALDRLAASLGWSPPTGGQPTGLRALVAPTRPDQAVPAPVRWLDFLFPSGL